MNLYYNRYISSVAIIIAVASNDPRKHGATNENRLHFTVSRNFQSDDPETLVAFTPDPSAAKKKEGSTRGREGEGSRGRGGGKKEEVVRRSSQGV